MTGTLFDYPARGAVISPCGTFRYSLWRTWGPGRRLVFVMLNPSTADAMVDDPTIRKCCGFAKRLAYDGIEVVNLFAYRATDPRELIGRGYPDGPENDQAITAAAQRATEAGGVVVCAWGAHGRMLRRAQAVKTGLAMSGARLRALRLLDDGTPAHPLMLPYSCRLVELFA